MTLSTQKWKEVGHPEQSSITAGFKSGWHLAFGCHERILSSLLKQSADRKNSSLKQTTVCWVGC